MRLYLLQKRGDTYHFRWVIPPDLRPVLGRREFTKSLNTCSRLDALANAGELYAIVEKTMKIRGLYKLGKMSEESLKFQIQQIWDQIGQALLSPPSDKPLAQAQEDNDNLYRNLRSLAVDPSASVAAHNLTKALESEGVVRSRFTGGATKRRYLRLLGNALEGAGLEFDEEDLNILAQQLFQAQAYYAQRMNDFLDVDKPIQPPTFVAPIAAGEVGALPDNTPLFSEFYYSWLSKKMDGGLSEKLQASYARFYSDWLELVPDKPLAQYGKKEIRDFILKLSAAPRRNLKEYRGRPLSELLELDIPNVHRIAPKTADEARKWLQGVFSLARTEELIAVSPATNLKLNFNSSRSYGNYEDEQVSTMLEAVQIEKSWKKWVVWIAAYTGMRRKEIVQLRREDIKLDSESQRYYIRVTDEGEGQSVKSEAGKRKVPIHRKLKEIGFLDFIADCEDRLFPELNPQSVTSWFNVRFKAELGIPTFNESCDRLVFHSFWHCVITKALSSNEVVLVQEVVGHEKEQMGITSRYNHTRPLSDLLHVIDCIEYN